MNSRPSFDTLPRPPFSAEDRVRLRHEGLTGQVRFYRIDAQKRFRFGVRCDDGSIAIDVPSDALEPAEAIHA